MLTLLYIWLLSGFIGSAIIFYADLKTRLQWDEEFTLSLGDLIAYLFLGLLGPVVLYNAFKEFGILESLASVVEDIASKFNDVNIWTFKKK
jgi:hypothetical protein